MARRRRFSTSSAQARERRKASSFETILRTPSREMESLWRRIMFLSERACQRWMSLDMRPAISKAKTPTFDLRMGLFGCGWVEVRTASKLWDMAVFTLSSKVSSAM